MAKHGGRHHVSTPNRRLAAEPWSTEPVRASDELWKRLERYIANPEGFARDFPLRAVRTTRGEAVRAIVEEWLAEREAKL